jgi:hypothetical protein
MAEDLAALHATLQEHFERLDEFLALNDTLAGKSRFVTGLAQDIRLVSHNVAISASRLEDRGRPLAVVAQTIGQQAEGSASTIGDLTGRIARLSMLLRDLAFRVSLSRLQVDTASSFVAELQEDAAGKAESGQVGRAHESISALAQCLSSNLQSVFGVYAALEEGLRGTAGEVRGLLELLQTLHMVRLTGKVEIARIDGAEAFALLFDQIGIQLDKARTEMDDFAQAIDAIRSTAKRGVKVRASIEERVGRVGGAVNRLALV